MKKISISLIFLFIWIASCDEGQFVPTDEDCSVTPTYTDVMQGIVGEYCAYAGCHEVGFSFGDYTTYNGMVEDFATMKARVIEAQDMPPSYATGPKQLPLDTFRLFNCWINEGFPEN